MAGKRKHYGRTVRLIPFRMVVFTPYAPYLVKLSDFAGMNRRFRNYYVRSGRPIRYSQHRELGVSAISSFNPCGGCLQIELDPINKRNLHKLVVWAPSFSVGYPNELSAHRRKIGILTRYNREQFD